MSTYENNPWKGDSEKAEELIAYLKQEVIGRRLKEADEIEEAIDKASREFSISLSENEVQQLTGLLQKIGNLDLDLDSIKDQAQELYDKLSEIDTKSFFDKVGKYSGIILISLIRCTLTQAGIFIYNVPKMRNPTSTASLIISQKPIMTSW